MLGVSAKDDLRDKFNGHTFGVNPKLTYANITVPKPIGNIPQNGCRKF